MNKFSCAKEVHKIVIIRWSIAGPSLNAPAVAEDRNPGRIAISGECLGVEHLRRILLRVEALAVAVSRVAR